MTPKELMRIESYLLDRKKPDYELSGKIMKALDLLNRQQEMIDALIAGQETLQKALAEKNAEIERLKNGDAMMFPDTFEEFVKWFGFVDSGEHYTNGSELIQVFRVKQWLEHEFNRIEEENANYSRNNRSLTEAVTEMQKVLKKQNAEIEKLTYKFECLLCHATGSKLSKSTYSLRTMEIAVNDEVQQCCEEAKSEAIKEFAERLKEKAKPHYFDNCAFAVPVAFIDNLVKEMVGE